MSSYYSSEKIIQSVKRDINIPLNQNTFTEADILAFADEELMLALVPAIMSLHEDYLLYSEDVPLVQGQGDYLIPYRAVGNKLYDLQYLDVNGNMIAMSRTTMADQPNYNGAYTTNQSYAYYVKNNKVQLLPTINGYVTGSLRFIYYIRPSSLVLTSEVGVITNIDRTTGTISVSNLPDTFTLSSKYDFYSIRSPHNVLDIDVTPTQVSGPTNSITFDPSDIPENLDIGDHVALAGQCAIPQIPSDLHPFLAQKVTERVLSAQGDVEGLKIAQIKSAEMENRAGNIIDNRVDESPIKLTNRNGILRAGMLRRWYRRRG